MRTARARVTIFAVLGVVLTGAVGCGGDDQDASQPPSIVTPPLSRTMLTDAEVRRAGDTPRGAFLRYWWFLQNQAWSDAVSAFERPLIRAVGADTMIEGLKSQTTYYQLVRPQVTGAFQRGGITTVAYRVGDGSGKPVLRSVRMDRVDGHWLIVFDPFLDSTIRQAVQNTTQAQIDPTATRPSRRAVAAGIAAAQLQGRYLERRLTREESARSRSARADR